MNFQEKIKEDIKAALKEKNELRLSVLRMLSSAMHNKGIEKRAKGGEEILSEEEGLMVLRTEVKKRRDAIQEYTKGNRPELAQKEASELAILEAYMPKEIDDQEIKRIVADVVRNVGTITTKDFGKIMGEVMKRIKGQASGDRVSKAVKEAIQS